MSVTTIPKQVIEVDEELKVLSQQETERLTIVHCRVFAAFPTNVRIWPSTYLVQEDGAKSKLVKPFHISVYPHWTLCPVWNDYIFFTLVFEGLKRSCSRFYLFEDIPEPGGFYSEEVTRNKTDVYEVELLS